MEATKFKTNEKDNSPFLRENIGGVLRRKKEDRKLTERRNKRKDQTKINIYTRIISLL